ncbi:DUF3048 domain-containing protein [Desulfuribacillus alkaliarsenatis]|uniref:DUF3048 domain-containing protein n=1 Tax=Desulfuribacillus alkaliarsenatis TaxID=766136 RepID=A0A1E5G2C3_9FIRM|nr:DUF3048 domain-containing protein [Desulfuribacillus alkaliarsenatis]OEF97053.1 hypothetical protein BHF68_05490 [Desulfuribacillus alkaliarsenatis]
MKIREIKTITIVLIVLISAIAGLYSVSFGNEQVQERIDNTRTQITEIEQIIKAMNEDIKAREARLLEIEDELAKSEQQLIQSEINLAGAEERIGEKSLVYGDRLRSAYMTGGLSYLEMLLSADNIGDLIIRTAYIKRILNKDAEIVAAYSEEYENLSEQRAIYAEQHQGIENMRFEMQAQAQNLTAQRKEQDELLKRARDQLTFDLEGITPQAEREPIYGVVIDNASPARPQHGLSQASVVYEYEVEGRITRYLTLFSTLPKKVGPVRSAREHSIMLAMENNTHYIYTSAGTDVLRLIDAWNVDGTNALYSRSSSFFRDSSRRAPHNFYVDLSTFGAVEQSSDVVIRPAYLSRQGTDVNTVSLQYSNNLRIKYEYDTRQRAYRRFVNDQGHNDAEGKRIMARNIIIQYVPHKTDLVGRPTPDIVGSGTIDYYALGQHFKGTWRKDDKESLTRFFYEDGTEIERIYGQTWVQIVRPN